jgi:hypothetical protein
VCGCYMFFGLSGEMVLGESAIQLGYDVDWIYYMNNKNE